MGKCLRYFWLSALTMLTALFAQSAFANQIGEVGTQVSVDQNWVTVTLSGTYTDPIVVAKSKNLNGSDISQTRVQNVTSTSFQVKVKDFDYEQQNRSAQTVSYIVVERGAWVLPNGQKIEAGDVSMGCCDIDASTSFSTQFDATPAVIATPNTNRTQSVYYRVKDLTATSFNARFTDADAAGDPDILNWIAMETGGDTTYGIGALLTTTQGVDQTWTYGQTFAAGPQAFLTSRSYLDATPMTNRIRTSPTTTEVVFYQQAGSANLYHLAAEDVSAVVIPSGTVTGYPPLTVWNINDSGGGSLRDAITFANANASEDSITFDIDGTGPHIISPLTALPNIADDNVSLDGTSQNGTVCNTLVTGTPHVLKIQIDGVSSTDAEGLYVNADNVALSGLSITGFDSRGIRISGPSNNASVDCSYLGVNPDGTTKNANARGDSTGSVLVLAGDGATVTRSVMSGNDDDGGDVGVYISGESAVLTGNIIGLTADGSTALGNGNYGFNIRPTAINTTIGGIASSDRNIISGNGGSGLYIDGTSTVTILGNYIGTDVTGLIDRDNGDNGILATSSANGLTIGGTSAGARNVISGNTLDGISLDTVSNITILGNYIGIGADGSTAIANASDGIQASATTTLTIGNATSNGRNVISANGNGGSSGEGINITGGSTAVTILGNYIGTDSMGALDVGNLDEGIVINGSGTSAVIGDGTTAGRNIIAANNGSGVYVVSSATADINENLIGVGIGGEVLGNSGGVFFNGSGTGTVRNNTIANDSLFGVGISSTAKAAVIANEIYLNTGLGIDNNTDGLTLNDSGDVDTGGNDLLNFPVINSLSSDGATTLSYDLDLDVPANTDGYRIEFFANSAPDTTNGEGETYLGFFDTGNHAGGSVNYIGSITASEAVSVGTIISATTTRKTATSFDVTSEFSVNAAAVSPLVVTNTNDGGAGSLREAVSFANANASEDAITFAIPGVGTHTITPTTGLPHITDNGISIDGTTQSGASCGNLWSDTPHTLMIEIDFSAYSGNGLTFLGDDSEIRGLSLTGASVSGLYTPSDRFTLTCSYIGLAPDGTENGHTYGIAPRGADHVIGGSNVGDGNVISGNSGFGIIVVQSSLTNLTIEGNFIGTDPTGMVAAANGQYGISNVGGITGTPTVNAIRKNLISGNVSHGIYFESDHAISGASGDVNIAGNYIGVDRTGNAALPNGGDGINFAAGSISGVAVGGTTTAERNIISGNDAQAIDMRSVSNISILGNHIGTDVTGLNGLGNGGASNTPTLYLLDVTDINIGNGTAAGRNIISDGTGRAIQSSGTATNLAINDNYIGTDITGNTALKNGTNASATTADVFLIANVNNLDVLNNVIGPYDSEGIEFWSGSVSDDIVIQGNSFGVGADGTTPFSSGRASHGHILFGNGYAATNVVIGGAGVGEGNILANGLNSGISIDTNGGFTGEIIGNQIYNNAADGISIQDTVNVAIYQNAIYNNGGLGIDLSASGVSANDSGDGDAGPNDLLNFPVINSVSGAGTTISYDIDLDTVSNANGYRIDFYTNSAADPTGYGEGETHLGYIDVSHGGGNQTFTGTFTGTQAIAQGEIISATTTRKIGVSSYDVTSEFSFAYTSDAATELTATETVDVFDPTSAGLYALPGNDIISSMTVTNIGNSAADADSIVIIDAVPSEMIFYNGDMDDGGPATQAIYFTQTGGANLTFTYATDAAYSNSPTRPANMAGCTYTPSAGYDSNVTYVCFNPKGAMASGNPDPTFTAQFRARIK